MIRYNCQGTIRFRQQINRRLPRAKSSLELLRSDSEATSAPRDLIPVPSHNRVFRQVPASNGRRMPAASLLTQSGSQTRGFSGNSDENHTRRPFFLREFDDDVAEFHLAAHIPRPVSAHQE